MLTNVFTNFEFNYLQILYLNVLIVLNILKFIYSEKAIKFCENSTLLLTGTILIGQNRFSQDAPHVDSHFWKMTEVILLEVSIN